MMAVAKDYQNKGIGARLKWAQRERALQEGRDFIKWTMGPNAIAQCALQPQPLGVTVEAFGDNFYGWIQR
jgi:predicted GNAT superfamily acetyltransferase